MTEKKARLTFVDPQTGERSTLTVNLQNNTLEDIPESVAHLFPETEFTDNGYGRVIEMGLNGGGPSQSFQPFTEAKVVTLWQGLFAHKGNKTPPTVHSVGRSLQELEV